jgi:hypothetical protein
MIPRVRAGARGLGALVLAFCGLAGMPAPARAGVHFRATSRVVDSTPTSAHREIEVEGWVAGDRARLELRRSENPVAKTGTYLLTRDAGRTLYLVDPREKTYGRWNLEAMLGLVEGVTEAMGPLLDIEHSNARIERLPEKEGGPVAGLPTRLYRIRTRYTSHVRVLGIDHTTDTLIEQDVWRTDKLRDPALGVWLRCDPPRTGDARLDASLTAALARGPGFPLKVATAITSGPPAGGKSETGNVTRSAMEVTQLEPAAVPDASFELPSGYTEKQILPGTESEKSHP